MKQQKGAAATQFAPMLMSGGREGVVVLMCEVVSMVTEAVAAVVVQTIAVAPGMVIIFKLLYTFLGA